MAKIPTNLSVDAAVMERGKLYGRRHGTSVSQLVGDFLANLPDDDDRPELAPTVSLLFGIAAPDREPLDTTDAIEAYHRYIEAKHRQR